MREESLFDTNAVSWVGAKGLMQLMDKTKQSLEKDLGIKSDNVFKPKVNIKLGTFYLSKLMKDFDNDLIRVIASYNAGPHNIKKWNKRFDGYENDLDYYKNYSNLEKSFIEFINKTPPTGKSVICTDNKNIKKIYLFTPYPKKLNDEVIEFFKKEGFEITSNSYFDIASDIDIGKVDPEYLYEVLSNIKLNDADALFISCTALPVLSILDELEKKIKSFAHSEFNINKFTNLNKISNSIDQGLDIS